MPIDIDLNDPVTSAGLALGGGAGVVGSIMTNNFLNSAKDDFVKLAVEKKYGAYYFQLYVVYHVLLD